MEETQDVGRAEAPLGYGGSPGGGIRGDGGTDRRTDAMKTICMLSSIPPPRGC